MPCRTEAPKPLCTVPSKLKRRLADRTWFYDGAQENLHVRVKVKAGEDCIINLNFE
jgi:hypothetical protein